MRWSDIPFRPNSTTLRRFAYLGAALLLCTAGEQYFLRERTLAAGILIALAVLVGAIGIAAPAVLRPVFVGWMVLVFPIGWLTSHLILAFVFYCLFTPLGLFFRLIGRDALCIGRTDQESYWTEKPAAKDIRSYLRQS